MLDSNMCSALSQSSERTSLWQTQRGTWLIGWIISVQCVASDKQMTIAHQVIFMPLALQKSCTCNFKKGLIQSCDSMCGFPLSTGAVLQAGTILAATASGKQHLGAKFSEIVQLFRPFHDYY